MPTSPPKQVRALDRGLSVVEHLSNNGTSTLAELRRATGLTNATLLRSLETLLSRGWVRRNLVEGQYELSHSLGKILGESARAHPLAELAAPILLDMEMRKRGLPSDLCAIIGPGRLEVIESTRIRGPMAPARTAMGVRPSMVLSAHGRALLASMRPEDREKHLAYVRPNCTKQERFWLEDQRLEREVAETRKRGFGLRDRYYFVERAFDPGPDLGALAVPIKSNSGLHGTLSVLWLHEDMTHEDVLKLGALPDLRKAASRIGVALDHARLAAPQF